MTEKGVLSGMRAEDTCCHDWLTVPDNSRLRKRKQNVTMVLKHVGEDVLLIYLFICLFTESIICNFVSLEAHLLTYPKELSIMLSNKMPLET